MTKFVPNKEHSRTALIFYFHLKKTVAESYRLLEEAYDEHAPSQKTCERWFHQHFKIGDFDVADTEKIRRREIVTNTKTTRKAIER